MSALHSGGRGLAAAARTAVAAAKRRDAARALLASPPSWQPLLAARRALSTEDGQQQSQPRRGMASAGHGHEAVKPRTHEEQTEWVNKEVSDGWTSFGLSDKDREGDKREGHMVFFTGACIIILPFFLWYYAPDTKLDEWAQREAFLVLRDRESRGELPISPDLIPRDQIVLPTDEELDGAVVKI